MCGPGDAKGATDVGVTDTEIRVGTVADVGWSAAPGLLQPIFDGADAFVNWCNAAGGINGRKLTLDKRDSAMSNYLPQVKTSCTSNLALVGSMGVLDDTGVDAWVECGMPNFTAATVGAKAADAKLMVPLNPIPSTQQNVGGFHKLFADNPGIQNAIGTLYADGAAGARQQHTYNEAITKIGGKLVYTAQYSSAGQVNWGPYVQAMKNAGVKFLFVNATVTAVAGLQQAMATQNWYPDIQISPPQLYDATYLTLAGKVAKNHYVYIPTTPFETADTVPAVAQFLKILKEHAPKAKLTFFSSTAFSSWLLFAQSVKACGSQVTRACVMTEVGKVKNWTGGGLQGEITPSENKTSECWIVMKVEADKFTQVIPKEIGKYDCDPQNAPTVTP
ncbi:ABC transporter substrate-binding protein [Dactylosporangium fulvum]|uniref:ABC transporter substrate-binding protein n=1 Tax=Dactylosporangium fulvum TaxID=53359 RepID=A0ABY5WA54_9ACTN|nr:ABC transporter substrate-binding protein [Dactylosporangium fulvum]UWP86732.1 ABC transporter substrate-binding protein [Dactylosporangium fulvum]